MRRWLLRYAPKRRFCKWIASTCTPIMTVVMNTVVSFIWEPRFRLFLHVLVFVGYLCFGAAIFRTLEGSPEYELVQNLRETRTLFRDYTRECVSEEELEQFIQRVVDAANRGVSATRNVTLSEPNWSFGQAFFFAATVLTTIGYGRVTPLSDAGKAFCIAYAVVGIPLTLVLFTALVERILIPVKAILYCLFRKLGHTYKVFHIQLLHLALMVVTLVSLFLLVPAAVYTALEPDWNFLDSFYYCFISLTTIGLGDFIPGDSSEQPHRAFYKVATTVYLLLGLIMMMVVLSVLYDIPELDLGSRLYHSSDSPDEEQTRLRTAGGFFHTSSSHGKHSHDLNSQSAPGEGTSGGATYQSFQNQDAGQGEE